MPLDPVSMFRRILSVAVPNYSRRNRVDEGYRPHRRSIMPLLGGYESMNAPDDTQFTAGYDPVCGLVVNAFISDYSIVPWDAGTAQAGAATTITLRTGASAVNDFYNNQEVILYEGTGCGQTRIITDYTGASRLALVDHDWDTPPDNTTKYSIGGDDRVMGS